MMDTTKSDGLWLLTVAGLVIGGVVTIAGMFLLDSGGPAVLIVGVILLAFGGGSLFTLARR
ncbi:MAG: hypothetical protein JWP85_2148 [Rhodoglobus sp.]|nr:hypothetical protein [Rhodoglobus sp.]